LETSETAAQTGRMSGDERRLQILLVAIRLFSQHGFSGTTTKEIARQAKCIAEQGDDYAFFYNFALNALNKQQTDPDFMRLLFHSALEEHELAERFFEEFISRIYDFVGSYIARRQSEGAMREVEPRIIVRAFLGMIIHHSLNNILWDKSRRLLNISNEEAAHAFAEILLRGVLKEK
jgi:AcrR family transcriptional regulator